MKKNRLLAGVLLALLAAVSLCAAACTTPAAQTYTVSLVYEEEGGSVSLSPDAENGTYAEGTEVTVQVSPKSGYETTGFSVTGHSDAALSEDGTYTFPVQADTTVSVTFAEKTLPSYVLTLDYNEEQGSVSLSPASDDRRYPAGTEITVGVTPAEGYAVDTFTVNGEPAALSGEGEYTFEIGANTAIQVTFQPENQMTESLFATLQGSMLLEGQCINHDYGFGDELSMDVLTLFDATAEAIWQTEKFEGAYAFNAIYVNDGGTVSLVTHDADGSLLLYPSTNPFAEYFNPFALLSPADFMLVEENVYELAAEKADAAAMAITGYEEDIASFRLTLENGVFTQLQIKTERVVNADYGLDYEYEYLYAIKDLETAQVPAEWLADYVLTPEHAALQQALETAAAASNYTVSEHKVEITEDAEGSEDVDSTLYVTETAIYEDCTDWENGYTVSNGAVYPFTYDPETKAFTFDEALNCSIDELKAIFTFDHLAYSLVEYVGEETYSVRLPDCFIMEEPGELAGAVASLFAVGTDRIYLYTYALDCTITLKDGVLYQVSFTYDFMGEISEQVTLTFSDFGTTTLPIEIDSEPEPSVIPTQYIGVFKGEKNGTAYEIDITAETITVIIAGKSYLAEILEYDDYEGFTLSANGVTYYLYSISDEGTADELMFMDEDYSLMLTLTREGGTQEPGPTPEPSPIPTQYIGVFKGEKDGTAYEIDITAETITVIIAGKSYLAEIIEYDDYEGFILSANGVTYYLASATYDGKFDKLMFANEDYSFMVTLTREGAAA